MKKILTLILASFVITNCSDSNNSVSADNEVTFDLFGTTFYNEFFPCVGGEDYSPETCNGHDESMAFSKYF